MIHFLPNILSKEECKSLKDIFEIERTIKRNGDKDYQKKSFGFESDNFFVNQYMDILKPKVLTYINGNDSLKNENTYTREYKNGSILHNHIDKEKLNITISICLYKDINKEWPLCADINGEVKCLNTEIGDGILLFDADKIPHWRERLECNENESILQFFLHWKTISNIKNTKSLL